MNEILQELQNHIATHKNAKVSGKARLLVELTSVLIANKRPVILITSGEDFSLRLKNLRFFVKDNKPVLHSLPYDDRTVMHRTSADPLIRMERMASRFRVAAGFYPDILLTSFESLLERCCGVEDLQKHSQLLVSGQKISRDKFISELVLLGYAKVPHVVDRGTFAVRGSIIDVFVATEKHPIRIDLFGDEIESIKYFDDVTQRSTKTADSIIIGGVKEIFLDEDVVRRAQEKLTTLADHINYPTQKLHEKLRDSGNQIHFYGMEKLLPAFYDKLSSVLELYLETCTKDTLPHLIFDDKSKIESQMHSFHAAVRKLYEESFMHGDLIFPPENYFLSVPHIETLFSKFSSTDLVTLPESTALSVPCRETSDLRQDILKASVTTSKDEEPHLLKPLEERLRKLHQEQIVAIITVSSREHENEIKQLLEPLGLNVAHVRDFSSLMDFLSTPFRPHIHAYTLIAKNPLAFGAVFDFCKLALIAEDDIFGKRIKRKDVSGKQKGFATSISDLEINDLVVHVDHGVGQFKGLVRLNVRGVDNDYILLVYANEEKLYLPAHRINLVKRHGKKFVDDTVRLDKLGGSAWASKKKKVKEAVMAMAQDLLKLYAKREIVERTAYIAPDAHFLEFEANFEFETTHDQQKAIDDVIADLQKSRPMDRLVCGDVGYGKTEVAMRAAMLATLSNRQVAILAPTTVLAQQHGITFKERFKNTGVNIAVLSRFQKPKEVKQVLLEVKQHKVDIVIGTHRLLSPDVHFDDLGLLVVDEEQRFGIKDKEHLKKMRTRTDVLTMSATPIPRTMQMSYFGIRDLSIIETPPVDRRAIETQLAQFDDAVIREAILREIKRNGQVYFVHNRVQSIGATADYLRALVPEARIEAAHGQMSEQELERVMLSFMAHEIDVLVCTTIIETGIDVPTANTMFINDADDFGLSQLYQLRGRIGRSKERAFCFLLIKQKTEHLTPIAKTRLEILHKFSELGVGFRIAQHDLELRGAGDLLGKNQHGHMAAVGYDLYAELLQEAVKELKGQTDKEVIEPEVVLPINALISERYCPDLHERMSFYQRLSTSDSVFKIDALFADLEDLYGEAPEDVLALKTTALMKLDLRRIRALKLEVSRRDPTSLTIAISLSAQTPVQNEKLIKAMKEGSSLRITPQHKVIQIIPIAHENTPDALLDAVRGAIKNIERDLMG